MVGAWHFDGVVLRWRTNVLCLACVGTGVLVGVLVVVVVVLHGVPG